MVQPAWRSRLETIQEVLLALALIFGVHLLDHLVLLEKFAAAVIEVATPAFKTLEEDVGRVSTEAVSAARERMSHLVDKLSEAQTKGMSDLAGQINQLISASSKVGLRAIYPMRNSDVEKDVLAAVRGATKTVWLLGIAFSEQVSFAQLINELVEKKEDIKLLGSEGGLDVRILLLDPLRSPAVFRTFLETPDLSDVLRIVGKPETDTPAIDPDLPHLFDQTLYRHIAHSVALLRNHPNMFLRPLVKFYAHNPNCWLVIADDVAFYEPYALGRPAKMAAADPCLGPYMPVFVFQKSAQPFAILESHFDRLWRTTNVGVFHFDAYWKVKETVTQGIFDQRLRWFRSVHAGLERTGIERREWPHNFCEGRWPLAVKWFDASYQQLSQIDIPGTVRDSSLNGLSLELGPFAAANRPQMGHLLQLVWDRAKTPPLAGEFLRSFSNRELQVRRCEEKGQDFCVVGLMASA